MLAPNPAPGYTRRQLLPGLPQGHEHGSALRTAIRPGPWRLRWGERWVGGAEGTNWFLRLRKGLRWPDGGPTRLLPVWVQYRCYPYPFRRLSQGLGEGSLHQTVVSGAELRLPNSPH